MKEKFDRRKFLKLGAATAGSVILATTVGIEPIPAYAEMKRDEGEWNEEQISELASSMENRSGYPNIQKAGAFFRKNQNGEPALIDNLYFTENVNPEGDIQKLKIINVNSIPKTQYIAVLNISNAGREVDINAKTPNGFSKTKFTSQTKIDNITINLERTKKLSQIGLELVIATEANRYRAMEDFFKVYEQTLPSLPVDQDERQATILHSYATGNTTLNVKDNENGLVMSGPISAMSAAWADFQIFPDYIKARDLNLFTQEDLNLLPHLNEQLKYFARMNLFFKNTNGNFDWIGDKKRVHEAWMIMSARSALGISVNTSPKQELPGPKSPQQPTGPSRPA